MKFENTEVFNFDGAFRGMRNPMNSWEKSDSGYYGYCTEDNKWVKDGCSYDACLGACAKNKEFKIFFCSMKQKLKRKPESAPQ